MVYFAQDDRGGPIKIGYCKPGNEKLRLAQLQTHNAGLMCFTRVMDGDRNAERALHERFAQWRIRGEWFYPGPELSALANAISGEDMEAQIVAAAEGILAEGFA